MAEQRQTFRFRLPWSAPAATRPSQVTQAPSSPAQPSGPSARVQRRPFRPAGSAAPPTGQAPVKTETPPASPSSTQKDAPSRSASQRQNAPPPRGPRASPSPSSSPSSSREVSQQAKSITPAMTPTKEEPATTDITAPHKEQRRQEAPLQNSQKSQFLDTETPETEKVVDTLKGKAEQLASEKTRLKQPLVINPEPELKQASSKEPMEVLKGMDHEERDTKPVTHEDVFDRKKVLKIFGRDEHATKGDHLGNEKGIADARLPLDKTIKEDLTKIKHKLANSGNKHALNEKPFNFITLTGENTGAIMHLSSERGKRETPIHIHRGYKTNQVENIDGITENEGSSRGRKPTNVKDTEEPGKTLYVNNNAQGINNSLVLNSSVTERNPGVHVVLLHNKAAESVKQGNEVETRKTHKAEVSTVPAERLTYTPNIKRRCLKGLLLESSDSGPENSEKPRHHGCRAGRS